MFGIRFSQLISVVFLSILIGIVIFLATDHQMLTRKILGAATELVMPNSPQAQNIILEQREVKNDQIDQVLTKMIKDLIKEEKGEFAVIVEDLENSEKLVDINPTTTFKAASLYKLFLLAAVLSEVNKGNLQEDSEISASVEHLQEVLGFKEFGYDQIEGDTISYDVNYLMTRVATLSDNYAAIMLAEKIGWDKVQDQSQVLGAKSTVIKSPISTTADDIDLFFHKLYKKQVVSQQASTKIIDILSKSKLNNRIPDQLPDDLVIAHKTAELPQIRHDAGIVMLPNKPYAIVLMSQNLEYEDDGVALLSDISKRVYDYLNQSSTQ